MQNGVNLDLRDGVGDVRYYYHQNQHSSTVALTDEAGAIVEAYAYDPYGKHTVSTGAGNDGIWFTSDDTRTILGSSAVGNPYLFTGRRYDPETGLHYYRNRYYDCLLGRFVSRDPLGYADGVNVYQYVRSNPITYVDSFGFYTFTEFIFGRPTGYNREYIRLNKGGVSGIKAIGYTNETEDVTGMSKYRKETESCHKACCKWGTAILTHRLYYRVVRTKQVANIYGAYSHAGKEIDIQDIADLINSPDLIKELSKKILGSLDLGVAEGKPKRPGVEGISCYCSKYDAEKEMDAFYHIKKMAMPWTEMTELGGWEDRIEPGWPDFTNATQDDVEGPIDWNIITKTKLINRLSDLLPGE